MKQCDSGWYIWFAKTGANEGGDISDNANIQISPNGVLGVNDFPNFYLKFDVARDFVDTSDTQREQIATVFRDDKQ
jgi:hypothetical protein